ncbi:hypothetical protein PsorP6_015036 [Peronosclerospora sorghi]|uniref:Uncharacterized protein n=1 Tax=Peronosclerospora sorghi TaxID=230839 RepID=A0ACC0VSA0_9STRA|nr:hypothetical protein PsorP6_015036 [Peronosclerospora sorghi]
MYRKDRIERIYSYKRKYLENGSSHGLTGSAKVLGSARATAEPASAERFSTLKRYPPPPLRLDLCGTAAFSSLLLLQVKDFPHFILQ